MLRGCEDLRRGTMVRLRAAGLRSITGITSFLLGMVHDRMRVRVSFGDGLMGRWPEISCGQRPSEKSIASEEPVQVLYLAAHALRPVQRFESGKFFCDET